MDRKTLEYMEERAKNARKIVYRIDELTKDVERIYGSTCVKFLSNSTAASFYGYELVKEIQEKAIEAIKQEIQRLEQELAEL